jgi:hypothetical protein
MIALTLQVTAASSSACKSKCDIYWRGLERDELPIPDSSYIARIPGTPAIIIYHSEMIYSAFDTDQYTIYFGNNHT